MAQRVNPIIFRLGKTKLWNSKYLEKKTSELPYFDFQNLEIKKFTLKFFKDQGFEVQKYKMNYCNNGGLNFFIAGYKIPKKNLTNIQTKTKPFRDVSKKAARIIRRNYPYYSVLNYINKIKEQINSRRKFFIIKDGVLFNFYRFRLKPLKFLKTINRRERSFFLNDFIESLIEFIGKKLTVNVTFKLITKKLKKRFKKHRINLIKKEIFQLNQFKQASFFKEGVHTLFICRRTRNSANLLAEFIATQLKKNKKQSIKFFFNFIQKCFSSFRGKNHIKIQIKGRLSKGSRAKRLVFKIASKLPILTINANIDYAEKVAYTSNGTVGVKVWIYDQRDTKIKQPKIDAKRTETNKI
jgi:hypothetical protein